MMDEDHASSPLNHIITSDTTNILISLRVKI